ncbi:SDR family oxidoreductase [Marinicrinis lubricantis]|uniref:SDR family oxidoreductase n=1 Tax=Marinicrinis lubricantis TaxID=2086470 RepID=A0ABW1IUM2_9BACL
MGLQQKVALITGGARGLGKMTAFALAQAGCSVAVSYVNSKQEADQLVDQLKEFGVRSAAYRGDITKSEDIQHIVEQTVHELGDIDILINNAGPFVRERKLFADYTAEEIRYLLSGNLLGVMELDHLVLPAMRKKGWGRIIHFGFSHAAEARGWPHRAVYAASKVGLVSFTKTLAVEEAQFGITVNMVCPGDIRGDNKEKWIHEVKSIPDMESPRGRPGAGEDVARAILFLCEDKSDFITGNMLDVSGGLDPIRTLPIRS